MGHGISHHLSRLQQNPDLKYILAMKLFSEVFIFSKVDIIPLNLHEKLSRTEEQWPTNFIDLNILGVRK